MSGDLHEFLFQNWHGLKSKLRKLTKIPVTDCMQNFLLQKCDLKWNLDNAGRTRRNRIFFDF